MKLITRFVACTLLLAQAFNPAKACTLWAAAGADASGGTLISKNRDWAPDHTQKLKRVHPKKGFAYFGLYAEGNNEPGLKAGVNEKGLTIISASVNLSKKELDNQPGKRGIMTKVMERYANIDDLNADAEQVFSSARASYFLIADRKKVMIAEVGLEGKYSVKLLENGATTHTNHYLAPELALLYNNKINQGSVIRLNRINELLTQAAHPFTLMQFADISRDQHDGPDNSLWRTGKANTLASWIMESPTNGVPKLRVVIANPGEAETTQEFVLDEAFWKK